MLNHMVQLGCLCSVQRPACQPVRSSPGDDQDLVSLHQISRPFKRVLTTPMGVRDHRAGHYGLTYF